MREKKERKKEDERKERKKMREKKERKKEGRKERKTWNWNKPDGRQLGNWGVKNKRKNK